MWGETFLLVSKSGKPEGPYYDPVGKRLTSGIDANLFEEDDGTLYWVWQNGMFARLKDDLSGLAEEPRKLPQTEYSPEPYAEGVSLFKKDGKYYLGTTIWSRGPNEKGEYRHNLPERDADVYSYDTMVAVSDSLYGPYGPRYTAICGGGHGNFFADKNGNWYGCISWNPRNLNNSHKEYATRPGIVPMEWDGTTIFVKRDRKDTVNTRPANKPENIQ